MRITIVRPSSRERPELTAGAHRFLEDAGHRVSVLDCAPDSAWPFCAGSVKDRAQALNTALLDSDTDVVWCARGGYGASDLLPLIAWDQLRGLSRPKAVVGLSDISALHWPIQQRLGWKCIHGPMPYTDLWGVDGDYSDATETLAILEGEQVTGSFAVNGNMSDAAIDASLFGGCLSIISSLIGTPFVIAPEMPFVFFFEDTGESPPRLMRMLQQCFQSGLLMNCVGLVVGDTREIGSNGWRELFLTELGRRFDLPIWETRAFGHVHPNRPLPLGCRVHINATELIWSLET